MMSDNSSEQNQQTYLLLHIGDEVYAVAGEHVREIARWREPLAVPGTPPVLPGILSQRGIVLPVVNMHALLGLSDAPIDRATRFVIIHYDEVDMALVVDSVTDLIPLSAEQMEPLPSTLDPQKGRLLQAIVRMEDRPVAVLDLATIIATLRSGV